MKAACSTCSSHFTNGQNSFEKGECLQLQAAKDESDKRDPGDKNAR